MTTFTCAADPPLPPADTSTPLRSFFHLFIDTIPHTDIKHWLHNCIAAMLWPTGSDLEHKHDPCSVAPQIMSIIIMLSIIFKIMWTWDRYGVMHVFARLRSVPLSPLGV
ncbi:hypothetical protein BD779DRAFT_1791115 [Infundibulicybe gibba]|nr:hypothetical protein BD779DRAFT_1791115 [Infundibulicybe gibba]